MYLLSGSVVLLVTFSISVYVRLNLWMIMRRIYLLMDVADILRNGDLYRNTEIRPAYTYASLIRQVSFPISISVITCICICYVQFLQCFVDIQVFQFTGKFWLSFT